MGNVRTTDLLKPMIVAVSLIVSCWIPAVRSFLASSPSFLPTGRHRLPTAFLSFSSSVNARRALTGLGIL